MIANITRLENDGWQQSNIYQSNVMFTILVDVMYLIKLPSERKIGPIKNVSGIKLV